MLRPIVLAATLVVAFLATFASAQTPTPTPYGGATGTPMTPTLETPTPPSATSTAAPTIAPGTPTPIVTNTPVPTPTPISDGGEPPFNYDVVKEIVVPLEAGDGKSHWVTLSQDTAGVVRIRASMFQFPRGHYFGEIRRTGTCPASTPLREPALAELASFDIDDDGSTTWVLMFWNTAAISLTPGVPASIYDADGTSLVLRGGPVVADPAPSVACAVLAPPVGAPAVGTGHIPNHDNTLPTWPLALGATLLASTTLILALRHRR